MGSGGERRHISFHFNIQHLLHHHHHHNHHHDGRRIKDVPKGCMAVMVGHEGEEQLQRFVIPIVYINHPKFLELLKVAEEEYGFDQKGPITIPCHVEHFCDIQEEIDRERHTTHHHHHHHDHHGHHHDHHNHHNFLCFKA